MASDSLISFYMNEMKRTQFKRRRGGFQPPFCPNSECTFHQTDPDWRFIRFGYYSPSHSNRSYQVFRCMQCGRRFTALTFSTSYWLHRKPLLVRIARLVAEGPGLRQIARVLQVSHSLVGRYVARLGRHCLLFLQQTLKDHIIDEKLVIDGFETFEYSQYYPFHINLAVGADSWFIYNFTDSPLRRKGSMREEQKKQRETLERKYGKADPKAVENGIYGLLKPLITHLPGNKLALHSDDHKAYPRALQRLKNDLPSLHAIDQTITSSKARRTSNNPLFPANLTDLRLRHGSANHRRETIAFSKRRQCAMERMAILALSHNFIKKRSENGPMMSAGMMRSLTDRMHTWREVLRRRLFPGHANLSTEWDRYYWRDTKTAIYGDCQARHSCRMAI